jgi:hypothetical protein
MAGVVTLVAAGSVRTEFFASNPLRLFYGNVDKLSGIRGFLGLRIDRIRCMKLSPPR